MMKNITFSFLFALICFPVVLLGQDKIFFKDGRIKDTKVRIIYPQVIFYRVGNDSAEILKSDVERIVYQNGTAQRFAPDYKMLWYAPSDTVFRHYRSKDWKFARNLLCVDILQVLPDGYIGTGIGYEKIVNKSGLVSMVLPAIITFRSKEFSPVEYPFTDRVFYLQPGFKFYPTGYAGRCRLAVGPSLLIGFGSQVEKKDASYFASDYEVKNKMQIALIVNSSLNIALTEKWSTILEINIGYSYVNILGNSSLGNARTDQLAWKVGYRF